MLDETRRVVLRGPQRCRVIEETHHGARPAIGSQPRQGALARLPGAVDKHHAGIRERLGHEALRVPRNQIGEGSHVSSLPHDRDSRGHLDGHVVVIWTDTCDHLDGTAMVI